MNQVNEKGPIIKAYDRSRIDGAEEIRHWADGFKPGAEVLEIGFGRDAIPQLLIDAGLQLYLVESSPSRLGLFQGLFPEVPSDYSRTEECWFFNRTFDGVIVCGLTNLTSKPLQIALLAKIERVLCAGGRLMVIFPPRSSMPVEFQRAVWTSRPASGAYEAILWNLGLEVQSDFVDQSGNEYVSAVKHVLAGVPN